MTADGSSRKALTDGSTTTTPTHTKPKKAKASAGPSIESSRAGTPLANDSVTKPNPPTSALRMNSEGIETQQCKHCKKFVPREGFQSHSKQCLRDKKEKKKQKELMAQRAQAEIDRANGEGVDAEGDIDLPDGDTITLKARNLLEAGKDDTLGSTPASTAAENEGSITGDKKKPNNKKRKADPNDPTIEKPLKKKKTQQAKDASATSFTNVLTATISNTSNPTSNTDKTAGGGNNKTRGPVDVERQCGVEMPNGKCARSLTCKSHSMGAKRAVPGRSAPYDILLAQYQKKNQAKIQRAAIAQLKGGDAFDEDAMDRVDSDEEREAVVAAVGRTVPRPLIGIASAGPGAGLVGGGGIGAGTGFGSVWGGQSVRARYQHVRMKEMLSNALGGNRGGNLFAVASKDAVGDAEGDVVSVVGTSRRQSMHPVGGQGSVGGLV